MLRELILSDLDFFAAADYSRELVLRGMDFFWRPFCDLSLFASRAYVKRHGFFFGRSAAAALLLARIDIKGHRFFFCGRSAASAYLLREQMLREMDFFNVIYADRLFFTYWDLSFDAFIKPSSYVEVAVPK